MSATKIERPRGTHDVVPAEQPLWRLATGEAERLCALYGYRPILTPVFEDTALFERTSGAGSDVVQKEMYTFEDRGGRSLTLRPGGDRADLPRVRRARHAPRPAAREALHGRADVPLRGSAAGPLPRALAALRRGDRLRRPLRRRRGDPALRRAPAPARDRRLLARAQLDRLPRVPARVPRAPARRGSPRTTRASTRPTREKAADEPAARVRQPRGEAGACPGRAARGARRSATRCARRAGSTSPRCARDLDAFGVAYELVPTLVRGLDYYTRTTWEFVGPEEGAQSALSGGGRYDGLVEEIGGPPTPGVGFGAGIERLLLRARARRRDGAAAGDRRLLRARGRRRARAGHAARSSELRARGPRRATPTTPAARSRASSRRPARLGRGDGRRRRGRRRDRSAGRGARTSRGRARRAPRER